MVIKNHNNSGQWLSRTVSIHIIQKHAGPEPRWSTNVIIIHSWIIITQNMLENNNQESWWFRILIAQKHGDWES